MGLLLFLLLTGQAALAFLPDPEACCSHVEVKGGRFTVEGRYNLDTFNGDQVLLKDDFWGVTIISYNGWQWSLCETSGQGSCYMSDPTNATCVEEGGGLFGSDFFTQGETLEVSCTLALAWYYILVICLAGAGALLVCCTLLYCCCCQSSPYRRRRHHHQAPPAPYTVHQTGHAVGYPVQGAPYKTQDASYPYPGAAYQAPGAHYQTPDAPYQAPDAPYSISGAPWQAPGAPYSTSGAPWQAPGAPSQTPGAPCQAPGAPYQAPGAPDVPPPTYHSSITA